MTASRPADEELTIGELAVRTGIAASALRFYERRGLISSRRTSGNQRRYRRETLRRVAFIRASQELGMPLSAIGDVLALLPENAAPTEEVWARAAHCWGDRLNARIEQLERTRARFARCAGCGCLSFDGCALVS
ncbi:redox-sensitive transcriptional activator SoxR [Streptomyces litchfieldiae]|uniref:Redox-sensitive transcriptional activator SoxR n=1 Tax=Streptomyces litchfieldiae TaxID=3075543 RepID=A0ABU2MNQ7_9ACTN|nr:redox-sensitive transcriptional activator SoxR [Streptomyces sp. DSM 44938]MDT0343140.1 redox-sensitive transcriptional activator SoxR [Streptomyces sp. DSM 44938]